MVPRAKRANNFLCSLTKATGLDATLYTLYYTERALLNGALRPLSVC